MDLADTPQMTAFRERVRDFVQANVPADQPGLNSLSGVDYESFVGRWRKLLYEIGWLAPAWPVKYGGAGLTAAEHHVLCEELFGRGLPIGSDNDPFGINMLGNTMLRWSDDELCGRFLPPTLSGEYVWCQGFSEPGAGSDLASLQLRARLNGSQWVLNGQKVWSSLAYRANWMFVLARTDPAARPHRGISMLLVPMDQPGIEVRPIRNVNGENDFCEVFFDDAVTEADHVVGDVNNGWAVAMTLLGYERGESALAVPAKYRAELTRLIELARDRDLLGDWDIRRRLAWCNLRVEQLRCEGLRILTRLQDGIQPGPEAGVFKLLWSEYHQQATELALDILGPAALTLRGRPSPHWFQTDDGDAPNSSASWDSVYLNARAGTIYAGTSQIQLGIIGEMLLGLPKESAPKVPARPVPARPA
jgi:hypothetical protein